MALNYCIESRTDCWTSSSCILGLEFCRRCQRAQRDYLETVHKLIFIWSNTTTHINYNLVCIATQSLHTMLPPVHASSSASVLCTCLYLCMCVSCTNRPSGAWSLAIIFSLCDVCTHMHVEIQHAIMHTLCLYGCKMEGVSLFCVCVCTFACVW